VTNLEFSLSMELEQCNVVVQGLAVVVVVDVCGGNPKYITFVSK